MPFIEGDGTGPDIWRASQAVFDAVVGQGLRRQAPHRSDGGLRGEKAFNPFKDWFPEERKRAAHYADRRRHPFAQRDACQALDPRLPPPVRYFAGVPSRQMPPNCTTCGSLNRRGNAGGSSSTTFHEASHPVPLRRWTRSFVRAAAFPLPAASARASSRGSAPKPALKRTPGWSLQPNSEGTRRSRVKVHLISTATAPRVPEARVEAQGFGLALEPLRDASPGASAEQRLCPARLVFFRPSRPAASSCRAHRFTDSR